MAEKKSAKETNGKDSTKETKTRTAKTKADSRAKTEPKAKKEPAAKMTAKPAAKSKQRTKSRAKAKPKMNLKVIALGGLDEIGKKVKYNRDHLKHYAAIEWELCTGTLLYIREFLARQAAKR